MRLYFYVLGFFAVFSARAQTFTPFTSSSDINTNYADWMAIMAVDVDNDYDLDLWVGDRSGNHAYYQHEENLNFKLDNSINIASQTSSSFSSSWADMNNDCMVDVVFPTRYNLGNNSVFKNTTSGFTPITSGVLFTDTFRGVDAAWADFDKNGLLDLFISQRSTSDGNLENSLYKNLGSFAFEKIDSGAIATDASVSFSASWGDYNGDAYPDLFLANRQNQKNFLYKNVGGAYFIRDTTSAVEQDADASSSGAWGDYNNDGHLDLFVANAMGEKNDLFLNNGNGSFTQIMNGAIVNDQHMSLCAQWADFDNDGYLDLFVTNSSTIWGRNNFIYKNNGNGTFTKISSGAVPSEQKATYAVATADFNKDGFIDIVNANRYSDVVTMYLNDGNSNHFLHLNLAGSSSNREAVGAKVVIKTSSGKQYRSVFQSNGLNTRSELAVHFGLGSHTSVDSVQVFWPSGGSCTFASVPADGFYNIREDLCVLDTVTEAAFADSSHYLTAFFSQEAKGAVNTYSWEFGDGSSSSQQNPSHTYTSPGNYEVCLTVYDDYCKKQTYCDSIEICPDTSTIGFISTHQGLAINFSDTSNSTGYQFDWDFGDGQTGTGNNISHTYTQGGTYQVCLTVTDSCRTKQYCRSITACNDTVLAGFSTSGTGLTISFADSSLNASSVSWTFGDGSSSTSSNPTHTFPAPGYYVVCQTAQDACTSTTLCDTIGVCLDTAKAGFTYTTNGNLLNFSSTSQNANTYLWDFGDGNFSTNANPSHIYQSFGTYTVCLIVENDCYTDSLCETISVCAAPGQAAFTHQSSISPLSVQFTSQSVNATSHYWDFDDGSFSTNKNPLKVFSDPVIYNVCLSIIDSCGIQDTTCQSVDLTSFSTKELAWMKSLEVYPNPTNDKLYIQSSMLMDKSFSVELYDVQGQKLVSENYKNYRRPVEIDLSAFSKGLYLLKVKSAQQEKTVRISRK